eukprot:m.107220 g.107220  ORF g.107220 m.107220 type:complete len:850 (-) comp12686_c1_seq3:939-3488(-)
MLSKRGSRRIGPKEDHKVAPAPVFTVLANPKNESFSRKTSTFSASNRRDLKTNGGSVVRSGESDVSYTTYTLNPTATTTTSTTKARIYNGNKRDGRSKKKRHNHQQGLREMFLHDNDSEDDDENDDENEDEEVRYNNNHIDRDGSSSVTSNFDSDHGICNQLQTLQNIKQGNERSMDNAALQRFLRESKLFLAEEEVDFSVDERNLEGHLRTLEASTGVFVPKFHPKRFLYVLLVPTDTTAVVFYTTAFKGSVLVNYKLPHKAVELTEGFQVQKVVISVTKNQSSTDDDDNLAINLGQSHYQQLPISLPNTPSQESKPSSLIGVRENITSSRIVNRAASSQNHPNGRMLEEEVVVKYLIDIRKTEFSAEEYRLASNDNDAKERGAIIANKAPLNNKRVSWSEHLQDDEEDDEEDDEGEVNETSFTLNNSRNKRFSQQIAVGAILKVREPFHSETLSYLTVSKNEVVELLAVHGSWARCSSKASGKGGWVPLSCFLSKEQQMEHSQRLLDKKDEDSRSQLDPSHHQLHHLTTAPIHNGDNVTIIKSRRTMCLFHTLHIEKSFTRRPWISVAYCIIQAAMLIIAIVHDRGITENTTNPLIGPSPSTLIYFGGMHSPLVIQGEIYFAFTSLFLPVGVISYLLHTVIICLVLIPLERTHGSIVAFTAILGGGIGGNMFGCVMLSQLLLTGALPAVFGGCGAIISSMIVFKQKSAFVLHDIAVLLGLMLFCVIFGLFPFNSNWQAMGGFLVGMCASLHTITVRSTARLRHGEVVEEAVHSKFFPGPYLHYRYTKSRRRDIGYCGLLVLCIIFLVLCALAFVVLGRSSPSCDWCVKASCFPAYNWCHNDTSTLLN